jgi:hypothetical protein
VALSQQVIAFMAALARLVVAAAAAFLAASLARATLSE